MTLEKAVRSAVPVAAIVACAGVVVSLIMLSGIGPKLSSMLVALSRGSLFLLLVYSMLASIVLGMGMTTIGVYVILAITVIPTLIDMGVNVYAAHLFAFYFGTISYITPPVALSSIAAAGISGADPMKTGYSAFRIGLLSFIVPFIFVYRPALILVGDPVYVGVTIFTSVLGVLGFAGGLVGYFKMRIGWLRRGILIAGGLLLIVPGYITDFIGIILLGLIWFNISFSRTVPAGSEAIDEMSKQGRNEFRFRNGRLDWLSDSRVEVKGGEKSAFEKGGGNGVENHIGKLKEEE